MQNKQKFYTFEQVVKMSPLSESTITKRFYGKDPKRWGVVTRSMVRTVKGVSSADFNKYFTKSFRGKFKKKKSL